MNRELITILAAILGIAALEVSIWAMVHEIPGTKEVR